MPFFRLIARILTFCDKTELYLGEGAKKKEKKLTNVSFAFTHTYTLVKTKNNNFFPQAYDKKSAEGSKSVPMRPKNSDASKFMES